MSQWKPLLWVGGSKKDLQLMPGSVQDIFGFALHLAQEGSNHPQTKALKGFGGIATTQHDIQLIKQRLKAAQDHAEASKGD